MVSLGNDWGSARPAVQQFQRNLSYTTHLPTELLRPFSAMAKLIWEEQLTPIQASRIEELVRKGDMDPRHYSSVYDSGDATQAYHERRIAYLVENPDPFAVEVSVCEVGPVELTDGNHRLVAALVLGDALLRVLVEGYVERLLPTLARHKDSWRKALPTTRAWIRDPSFQGHPIPFGEVQALVWLRELELGGYSCVIRAGDRVVIGGAQPTQQAALESAREGMWLKLQREARLGR